MQLDNYLQNSPVTVLPSVGEARLAQCFVSCQMKMATPNSRDMFAQWVASTMTVALRQVWKKWTSDTTQKMRNTKFREVKTVGQHLCLWWLVDGGSEPSCIRVIFSGLAEGTRDQFIPNRVKCSTRGWINGGTSWIPAVASKWTHLFRVHGISWSLVYVAYWLITYISDLINSSFSSLCKG